MDRRETNMTTMGPDDIPTAILNDILTDTAHRYPLREVDRRRSELAFVTLDRTEDAVGLITRFRDFHSYSHLVFLTAVDYPEHGEFALTYLLHSYANGTDIGVIARLDRGSPVMDSIHHLWAQAATYQRELFEMFGIIFPGSPGLEEPFALEGWDGPPPMRRDFDTKKYSEETYFPRPGRHTKDPAGHMKATLHPEESNG